jgi:hypothetical protein
MREGKSCSPSSSVSCAGPPRSTQIRSHPTSQLSGVHTVSNATYWEVSCGHALQQERLRLPENYVMRAAGSLFGYPQNAAAIGKEGRQEELEIAVRREKC